MAAIRFETPEDYEHLRALARRRSPVEREALVITIGDVLEEQGNLISDKSCAVITEILRSLQDDIETQLRAKLACRLAANADVPRDVILLLANDRVEVAYPVLLGSSVLQDPDLVEIVRIGSYRHRLAVALRPGIGETITDELARSRDEDVLMALIDNHSARISPETLRYLVDEARRREPLQAPLVSRPDLPQPLAERLYRWVSRSLRQRLLSRFDIDPTMLDAAVEGAITSALAADGFARENDPVAELTEELFLTGALNGPFLVNALKRGDVVLFEAGLARLAELTLGGARRVIYELDGEALAFACVVGGIDRESFISIFQITQRARGRKIASDSASANSLRATFDQTTVTDAQRRLAALVAPRTANA